MDQKGLVRFVNSQTESLFGYQRDRLVGEPIETLIPEPLWQIYAEHQQTHFSDPRTRSLGLDLELIGRRQDGTEFPVNVSLSHIDTGDVLLVITAVHDVNRQRQAVRKAELVASIVEYSDDAIMSANLEGTITSWNPAAERLYGYPAKDVIGRYASFLMPRERAGDITRLFDSIKGGQGVDRFETVRLRKDGVELPVSITISPIRDEDGEIVGATAIHRDITEQKKAFETAQRMTAIVEGSDDAIIGCTLDGIVTSWNPAAATMFGYRREEIIGTSVDTTSPDERPDETRHLLARIGAGEQIEHLETIRIRKDGSAFPVSLTVSPIRDNDATIVGASMISRDLTELKHAAQYARSLIEAALDPLVTISPEGIITDVNEATVKAIGIRRNKLIGTDFSRYFTDPGKAHHAYQQVFVHGSVIDYPLTLRHRNGTLTDVMYNASVFRDVNGHVVGVFAAARDVTGQKRTLEAAQRMAAIVENSDDAIIGETPEGVITSWNPAAERMFGYSDAEIIGQSVSLLIPGDKAAEARALAGMVSTGQQIKHVETLNVRRDGTVFPVSLTISPIRDDGTVVGASVICRDITQQKKAFVTAQYMAAIVENSEDAIISGSLDGLVTSWNPAAERMYGYSAEEVVGKPAKFLTPPDCKVEIRAVLRKIKAGQHVERLETKRIRKDGTVFPVALTVSPILDPGGAVVGASVIHRDLSEQKGALSVAQRIAAIVENSHDAILGRTIDGTVTSWNPAAERMYGYSAKEIIGTSVDRLVPDDRKGEVLSFLAAISAGQSLDDFETVRVRKDGSSFPVSLTISPIRDEHGAVVGASVICRDVTELRHAAQYARSLIEAALDPLVTISAAGKITDVNEATAKAIGIGRNKLIGTDFARYFTDPGKANRGYQRAFRQGSVTDFPLTLRHRDGTLTDVLYNASVYRDMCGKVIGVFAAARDMTELNKGFEATQRIAAIVETSDDAIISSTLDGVITAWNPAAARMFGYPGEEIVGESARLLSPEDRPDEIKDILAGVGTGRRVEDFETIGARKAGTTFPVKLTLTPIHDAGGAIVGASVIARDVYSIARETSAQRPPKGRRN